VSNIPFDRELNPYVKREGNEVVVVVVGVFVVMGVVRNNNLLPRGRTEGGGSSRMDGLSWRKTK